MKGAARPAALLTRIEAGECDERGEVIFIPDAMNLYAQQTGHFWSHPETRKFVESLYDLGNAAAALGLSTKAIRAFHRCLEVDPEDHLYARDGLVAALLDEGRAGEARQVMTTFTTDVAAARTVFAYSTVLTEYVARHVLDEPDASDAILAEALTTAMSLNPFIAVFVCGYEIFVQVVEELDEIDAHPATGSIEEAFVYCSKNSTFLVCVCVLS